jgi:uncharacterized protein (DUF983 family)
MTGPASDPVDPDAIPLPTAGTMLRRAVVRHCPRCGRGHLFKRWFWMVERCPGCQYRFNREEGSSLGAYVINFAFTIGVLAILIMAMIIQLASNEDLSIAPWLAAAVVLAFVVPAVCYPFSWTIWTAIDLMLHRGRFGPSRSAYSGRYK